MKHLILLAALAVPTFATAQSTAVDAPKSLSDRVSIAFAWEVDGFSMPESAASATDHDWIYVSNVNQDQDGFISRLAKDGTVDNMQWMTGLGNPQGLALFEGKLYVGNSTHINIIDVDTATVVESITSDVAKTLNDVAVGPDGQIFVSDVIGSAVYTVEDGALVEFFSAPDIALPNGLSVQDGMLYIGDTAGGLDPDFSPDTYGSVYKVDLSDKSMDVVRTAYKIGSLDGVDARADMVIVASNATGELFAFDDRERIRLGTFKPGIADISLTDDALYAPFLFDNTLVAYTVTFSD